MRKNVFYIHTNIFTKKCGEKTRETIFPENDELLEQIMLEKIFEKKFKKSFFLLTRISCPLNGGGKRVKQFCQQHPNSVSNKCWDKIVRKRREKTFFIFTRISLQKNAGKKTRETIFPETHE